MCHVPYHHSARESKCRAYGEPNHYWNPCALCLVLSLDTLEALHFFVGEIERALVKLVDIPRKDGHNGSIRNPSILGPCQRRAEEEKKG